MTDQYQWWRDALAGKEPEIHADVPQSGFYKTRRSKGGPWEPVMIRLDGEGVLRCRVSNDSSIDPLSVWTFCAKHPVSQADAKHAFDTGSFPGEVETAKIGDNSGQSTLSERITDYAAMALDWLRRAGIKDKKSADMASNYRAELIRLRKEADAAREAEKRPHMDASRAVDAAYKPLIEEAERAANALRDHLTGWMREEEKRLLAEAEAKRALEQKAIDLARRSAEDQYAKKLRDDPIAALTDPRIEFADPAPAATEVKVQVGGQRGRKTGLKEVTRYVVKDHAAALAFFADSDDVKELIQALATKASKAGVSVPGVERIVEKVAA